jgi:pimeloyl-ACP methyl ester carboxylesterase
MPAQEDTPKTQYVRVPVSFEETGHETIRLAYTKTGSGPPMLLLHGLGLSRKAWQKNMDFLEQRGTVYALDLPGFGESEDPKEVWSTRQLALVVFEFLKALSLASVVAIGHSLGGDVCLWLAYLYPACTKALILAATPGIEPGPTPWQRALGLGLDVFLEPPLFMAKLYMAYYQAGMYRVIRTLQKTDITPLLKDIQHIKLPILLINGRFDPVVKVYEGRLWCQRLSGAELTLIPASHGLIFSQPEAFNTACAPFLLKNL